MDLSQKKCKPCGVGGTPFTAEEVRGYLLDIPQWTVSKDNKKITRDFKFKDFIFAMSFLNRVAELAETEGHHPDIHIHYNNITLELWTHAIGGLSENDFIMAAKINLL